MLASMSDTPTAKRRWYRLTPDRLILALLPLEGFFLLSERFRWFAFNERKGWTILVAVASVGLALLLMLLWFAASLLFRRRFQFSIGSLLVLVLVVAIPCSWLAVKMKEAREQKEAVRAARAFGWRVEYDFPFHETDDPFVDHTSDSLKDFVGNGLQRIFGRDFVLTVNEAEDAAHYANAKGCLTRSDADMEYLESFSQLKWLDLSGTNVDNAVLEHLKGLIQLETLKLGGTKVTDAGLKHLQGLSHLTTLDLCDTEVTNAGLEHLKSLAQLETLKLDRTKVTDAGLKHLHGLSQLATLDLSGTHVTNAGLECLESLAQLETLKLDGTKVTDAGLKHLHGLSRLATLDLSHTEITNAGLKELETLSKLKGLILFDTRVNEAGVARLKGRLPNLGVAFSTRLTSEDLKAIREFLGNDPRFRGLPVVSIDPRIGGSTDVRLRESPHPCGPYLQMEKSGHGWHVVQVGSWIGED
jgi:uncharacterized protein YjbI with pentapeptide repeats